MPSTPGSDESVEVKNGPTPTEGAQGSQGGRPDGGRPAVARVSHVVASNDGATVIVVTAEDKTIHVFGIDEGGALTLQSQRSMPKRISAVAVPSDDQNILVGDKFGDVYLLPLLPSKDWARPAADDAVAARPATTYTPSASELTVHTKGNREALAKQRLQNPTPRQKDGPDFELKLIAGHVALLTDLVVAETHDGSRRKQYILTADRDEHIRVSRGVTQAHVIENYCHGHRSFVSKLCMVPWNSALLIAGSGESSLRVYDWRAGTVLDAELFNGALQQHLAPGDLGRLQSSDRSAHSMCVSGVWPVHGSESMASGAVATDRLPHLLLVSLEGRPVLLSYVLADDGRLFCHQVLTLTANVLDVAVGPSATEIVVSLDTVHLAGSTREPASAATLPQQSPPNHPRLFETFILSVEDLTKSHEPATPRNDGDSPLQRWVPSPFAERLNQVAWHGERWPAPSPTPVNPRDLYSPLGEMLYGWENLRKRPYHFDMDAGPGEGTDAAGSKGDTA